MPDANENILDYDGLSYYDGKIKGILTQQSQQITLKADKAVEDARYSKQQTEIQFLLDAAKGQIAEVHTDSTEAYSKAVPTYTAASARFADIKKLGGKSEKWNQLFVYKDKTTVIHGITFVPVNGGYNVHGTTDGTNAELAGTAEKKPIGANHKIFISGTGIEQLTGNYIRLGVWLYNSADVFKGALWSYTDDTIQETTADTATYVSLLNTVGFVHESTSFVRCLIVDLTDKYGAGNEPTSITDPRIAEIKAFHDAHPEYNAGEIISADCDSIVSKDSEQTTLGTLNIPAGLRTAHPLRSAGSVHDEYDFKRMKFIKRIGVVSCENMLGGVVGASYIWYINTPDSADSNNSLAFPNIICSDRFNSIRFNAISINPQTIALRDNHNIYINNGSETEKPNGYIFYELKTPVETDISSYFPADTITYLPVEDEGSLTFHQTDSEFPIPNTEDFYYTLEATA